MKKKILVLALAAVMALSFTACAEKKAGVLNEEDAQSFGAAEEKAFEDMNEALNSQLNTK